MAPNPWYDNRPIQLSVPPTKARSDSFWRIELEGYKMETWKLEAFNNAVCGGSTSHIVAHTWTLKTEPNRYV